MGILTTEGWIMLYHIVEFYVPVLKKFLNIDVKKDTIINCTFTHCARAKKKEESWKMIVCESNMKYSSSGWMYMNLSNFLFK